MAAPAPAPRRARRRPAPVDEQRLVEHALAGDAGAARRVLDHVGPSVLHTVRGVLGRTDPDVDDLVQDSLFALLEALPAFRGDSRLRTFATRITTKIAMSTLRRRYRRSEPVLGDPGAVEGPVDLDAALLAGERMALVRMGLARLPRPQGEALMLRWMLGHSLAEVAAITGAPVNTVRSRLRLGRNALVERLREHPRWPALEGSQR